MLLYFERCDILILMLNRVSSIESVDQRFQLVLLNIQKKEKTTEAILILRIDKVTFFVSGRHRHTNRIFCFSLFEMQTPIIKFRLSHLIKMMIYHANLNAKPYNHRIAIQIEQETEL